MNGLPLRKLSYISSAPPWIGGDFFSDEFSRVNFEENPHTASADPSLERSSPFQTESQRNTESGVPKNLTRFSHLQTLNIVFRIISASRSRVVVALTISSRTKRAVKQRIYIIIKQYLITLYHWSSSSLLLLWPFENTLPVKILLSL